MKRLLVFIPLLFWVGITASAETIHTNGANEYSDTLYNAKQENNISVMNDNPEEINDERILMIRSDADIDDFGAQYDICDEYGIHTLIYNTDGEADAAYEHYLENGCAVCRNEKLSIAGSVPDDTYAPYLSWGVRYIGSDLFMNRLIKDHGSFRNMPEVSVAVIDSGIDYTHPRIKDRVDSSLGYDYYNNDPDPMDDQHHGTHVAGIIADNTLENVKIIPIKITNSSGNAETIHFKAGIQRAIELGVDVMNVSLATTDELKADDIANLKSVFDPLFDEAYRSGITICISAGNSANNRNNADHIFPAFMENTIVVSNCQSDGTIATTSNYGSVIDLAAPGTGIYSTVPVSMNSYASLSGTSMAAPFVTASAALLKTMDSGMTPSDIENTLKENLVPLSKYYYKSYGDGILNIGGIYYDTNTVYDAITSYEYNGSSVTFTIDNSKNILRNGAKLILSGSVLGNITRLQSQSVPATSKSEVSVTFHGYGTKESFGTIKAYLWDDLAGQQPLSTAFTVKAVN